MTYEILILGISIHMLLYEQLPHWGTWFTTAISKLPKPLQTLYQQWRCPYCCGFWIGVVLHGVTGAWLFPTFAELPSFWGVAQLPLGWFLDGLSFAILTKLGVLVIHAVSLPALLGFAKKQAFLAPKDD